MSTTSVTGATVVPAYRVVAHFVKQVRNASKADPLDSLEQKVRQYVRSSLAPLHGSYAEIGERWAVTQLGDPDLDTLAEALQVADKAAPRKAVEKHPAFTPTRPFRPLPAAPWRRREQTADPGDAGGHGSEPGLPSYSPLLLALG